MRADHCLDPVRTSLQCHADLTPQTFEWIANYCRPWPDFRTTHMCRDFSGLLNFVKAGQIPIERLTHGALVYPVLGPVVEGNIVVEAP